MTVAGMHNVSTSTPGRTGAVSDTNVGVHSDKHAAGVATGDVLVVNFDSDRVVSGGPFLVDIGGWPELQQLMRFWNGLLARIGGRWFAESGDDLFGMTVIGRGHAVHSTTERA